MKLPNNIGTILLAIWLVLFGLLTAPFITLRFNHSGDVLAILAIVTGGVLFVKR